MVVKMKNYLINKKFTVIGGGTGTFSVLSGLKKHTDQISAIVTMADSGGSAKKERDEWGLLPSSDVRKSLLALSSGTTDDLLLLRRLFHYRYSEGKGVAGMTFGNLFLVALTKLLHSQKKAISKAGDLLKIRGKVIPVTFDHGDLIAEYQDGSVVKGEHYIDNPKHNGRLSIKKLKIFPKVHITKEAYEAILNADCLIIGPGGFYTTIVANLVVEGVVTAIQKSQAKKIFVVNLMTEYGQTYNFTAYRFLQELNNYLSVNLLDYILINNSPIPGKVLSRYRKFKAVPVFNDLPAKSSFKVIAADLLSTKIVKKEKGDILNRSLIRHDPDKISNQCLKIMNLI
jgi:uncharacterized cofD-like protein